MNILIGIISLKIFEDYTKLFIIVFVLLFSLIILKKKKLLITENLFILIAFASTYYYILSFYSKDVNDISISCVLSYFVGIMIILLSKNKEKDIVKYTYSIAIGFFIHALLNYITNSNFETRNTIDVWTGLTKSATLQATMLTMILGSSFYSLVCTKNIYYKSLYIIAIILSLTYNMILGTRTVLVVSIISFIISWILYIKLNRKTYYLKKSIKIIVICAIIMITAYNIDFLGTKSISKNSNLVRRIEKKVTIKADESRIETQILAIKSVFEYPFGGNQNKIGNLKYAHNMWLDIAKEAGIIPFILLLSFFIININKLFKILKDTKYSTDTKIFLSGIYISVLLNFAVEPIIQGEPLFFIMFCMVMGMVDVS